MSSARIGGIRLKRRLGEGPITVVRRKKAAAVIAELTAQRPLCGGCGRRG